MRLVRRGPIGVRSRPGKTRKIARTGFILHAYLTMSFPLQKASGWEKENPAALLEGGPHHTGLFARRDAHSATWRDERKLVRFHSVFSPRFRLVGGSTEY